MNDDKALVWYEADGTRHVLGEPPPAPVPTPAESRPGRSDAAQPLVRPAAPEQAEPEATASLVEPTGDTPQASDSDGSDEPGSKEPSALGGMARALLLGAAAAAATGAVVGAISLAATGDRPDTVDETIVPVTLATVTEPVATEPAPTTGVETIDLAPPTTSADQPE